MVHRVRVFSMILLLALVFSACGTAPEATDDPQSNVAAEEDGTEEDTTAEDDAAAEDVAVEEPTPTVAPTPTPAGPTLSEGPAKDIYAVGDVARVNAFLIRVDEAKTATESEFGTPEEGNQFVLVSLTVENTSSERQEIAPLLHMSVQDGSGQEYPLDVSAGAGFLSVNGPVDAGETKTATIGYQVPKNATDLRWIFRTTEPDPAQVIKESGKAVFDIMP